MWMKIVATASLCPTSRSTTTTSTISSKMLRLTPSDQSKGRDFKSAFWNTVCVKLICIQVIYCAFYVWDGSVPKLSYPASPTQLRPTDVYLKCYSRSCATTRVCITTTSTMFCECAEYVHWDFFCNVVLCWQDTHLKVLFLLGGSLEARLYGTMSSCMWPVKVHHTVLCLFVVLTWL